MISPCCWPEHSFKQLPSSTIPVDSVAGSVGVLVAGSVGLPVAGSVGLLVAGSVGVLVAGSVGVLVAGSVGVLVAGSVGASVAASVVCAQKTKQFHMIFWNWTKIALSLH